MTGTTLTMSDVVLPQSKVRASRWTPESFVRSLKGEYLFDGGQTASLINHANPTVLPTLIGTPTFNAHSMTTAGNTQGVNLGTYATENDQTMIMVCKTPTAGTGGMVAEKDDGGGSWLGFFYGVGASGKIGFYNGNSGVSPAIPFVDPVAGGNFFCVIGWGSLGSPGNIRTVSAGALGTTVAGTSAGGGNGATRAFSTNTMRVGGASFTSTPTFEIAFAARVPLILTDQQQLDWYTAVKTDLTRIGLTVA